MKKFTSALICFCSLLVSSGLTAQILPAFCNPGGDLVIFSNYDGGILTIDVDKDIKNLKIGIVSYEPDSIIITGTYANNIMAVIYAGYVSTNHNHCNLTPRIATTTVNGIPSAKAKILKTPAATLSNPNGYSTIICHINCNIATNQGGCNTSDQVVDYFIKNLGGILYCHKTQYNCWSGVQKISFGGNCCLGMPSGMDNSNLVPDAAHTLVLQNGQLIIAAANGQSLNGNDISMHDILGRLLYHSHVNSFEAIHSINLNGFNSALYLITILAENGNKKTYKVEIPH